MNRTPKQEISITEDECRLINHIDLNSVAELKYGKWNINQCLNYLYVTKTTLDKTELMHNSMTKKLVVKRLEVLIVELAETTEVSLDDLGIKRPILSRSTAPQTNNRPAASHPNSRQNNINNQNSNQNSNQNNNSNNDPISTPGSSSDDEPIEMPENKFSDLVLSEARMYKNPIDDWSLQRCMYFLGCPEDIQRSLPFYSHNMRNDVTCYAIGYINNMGKQLIVASHRIEYLRSNINNSSILDIDKRAARSQESNRNPIRFAERVIVPKEPRAIAEEEEINNANMLNNKLTGDWYNRNYYGSWSINQCLNFLFIHEPYRSTLGFKTPFQTRTTIIKHLESKILEYAFKTKIRIQELEPESTRFKVDSVFFEDPMAESSKTKQNAKSKENSKGKESSKPIKTFPIDIDTLDENPSMVPYYYDAAHAINDLITLLSRTENYKEDYPELTHIDTSSVSIIIKEIQILRHKISVVIRRLIRREIREKKEREARKDLINFD